MVLVGASLVVYQHTKKHEDYGIAFQDLLGIPGRPMPTQSPVRVVGGSMKFRTTGSWTFQGQCPVTGFQHNTIQSCLLSPSINDLSALSLDGVSLAANPVTPVATSWLGLDTTWSMTIFARAANGSVATAKGVDVCVTNGTTCGVGNRIAIGNFDANTSLAPEMAPTGETETIYRYSDASYNGAPSNFLEHIGRISFKVNSATAANTYKCPNGICQISIGL